MSRKNKISLFIFLAIDAGFLITAFCLIFHPSFALPSLGVISPKGVIATQELRLLITVTLLILSIIVPVFIIAFFFAWKYRAGNFQAKYQPNLETNYFIGTVLWLIPICLIFTIGTLIWKTTHELDPSKKIISNNKPITIQVVALNWKWLFIYPEQNIATVNFVEFPENTPIIFELTADAPMNTFWIPQLGGQVYAMAGMQNNLNLMTDQLGEYRGAPSEINGKGYAGMNFKAVSVSQNDFNLWINQVKSSHKILSAAEYNELAKDSENNPAANYSGVEPNLFNIIMKKFMIPSGEGVNK